jgi:2-keto-4-pentenoate hydratase/2-oxohepta-3-ene-1,7-dioic acid hydratase in catechol pathway
VKLVTYKTSPGTLRAGVVGANDQVYDLAETSRKAPGGAALSDSLLDVLGQEERGVDRARAVADWAVRSGAAGLPLTGVRLAPPLPRPGKLIAVANNYFEHIVEGGAETFERTEQTPWLFIKPSTAIIGDGDPILLPALSDRIDWEIELAIVIGRRGRYIPEAAVYEHIMGYTIVNDVSARRINVGFERRARADDPFYDWLHGKWFDSFAPMGPWVVTRDEIKDPHNLNFSLKVDGHTRQADNTAKMIFRVPDIVVFASKIMTLEPGDIIATGTARGTGSATGTFLQHGQQVEATIDGLGVLHNPVQHEPRPR